MKKYNAEKLTNAMNDYFIGGIKGCSFEQDGQWVAVYDFDRGSRHDSEWLSEMDIQKETNQYIKKYTPMMKDIVKAAKLAGYRINIGLDHGEKGHISIHLSEKVVAKKKATKAGKQFLKDQGLKIVEKKEKKETKKLNQTDTIRKYIKSGKSHKSMIQGLAKAFGKKEAWAKSRINTYEKAYGNMGVNDSKLNK